VGVGDVLGAWSEDVEDEPTARHEQLARRTQCAKPRLVVEQVQERTERAGDEADPLLDRRRLQVAQAQVEQLDHARQLGALAADLEHPWRGVDADHADASRGRRNRDPAGPHRQLDDRRRGPLGLLDVELHVLGDADAPRVVEASDRVVQAHPGLRATQTNSSLESSNGRRSNQP
jgi:hypothetical protein